MKHAIIKKEKEEFDEEMFDYLPPIDASVKSEPHEMCVEENIQSQSVKRGLNSEAVEEDEECWPFSGKPLFHMVLSKSHVTSPYAMGIPVKMNKELPNKRMGVVLRYCGKNWEMVYHGNNKANKRFDCNGWKSFVLDNKLKEGYGCFFELSECTKTRIKFRVQVIRTDSLLPFLDDNGTNGKGETPDKPIIID